MDVPAFLWVTFATSSTILHFIPFVKCFLKKPALRNKFYVRTYVPFLFPSVENYTSHSDDYPHLTCILTPFSTSLWITFSLFPILLFPFPTTCRIITLLAEIYRCVSLYIKYIFFAYGMSAKTFQQPGRCIFYALSRFFYHWRPTKI